MADNGAQFTVDELPDIPDSWQWGRLGDLVDQSRGICYGIVQPGKHDEFGVPMVNSQDVLDGTVASRIEFRVAKELHARFKRSTIRGGEVLLTLVGANFGRVAIAPRSFAGFNCSRAVGIIPVREHPQFVKFCLRSPLTRRFLDNWANTTAQPTFNLKEVANLPIPLPPLVEQKAIATVLGALDDKVELNRRMNATLEAMARALFQSWFVDFGPVRAKLDGRQPAGLDEAIAALFPEHFEDGEHGKLPAGWRHVAIEEVCDINAWTLGKNDDLATLEYVEISEVSRGNIATINLYARGEEPSRARRRLRHGDTVLSTVRPDRGSYFLALHPPKNRVASTGFTVLTPTDAPWSFVHAAMTLPEVSDHLGQMADGGAYPAVRPEIIGAIKVAMPNEPKILEAFHRTCAPLFELADANRTQSRTLAILSDTLLPKLLSGELSPRFTRQIT